MIYLRSPEGLSTPDQNWHSAWTDQTNWCMYCNAWQFFHSIPVNVDTPSELHKRWGPFTPLSKRIGIEMYGNLGWCQFGCGFHFTVPIRSEFSKWIGLEMHGNSFTQFGVFSNSSLVWIPLDSRKHLNQMLFWLQIVMTLVTKSNRPELNCDAFQYQCWVNSDWIPIRVWIPVHSSYPAFWLAQTGAIMWPVKKLSMFW